MAVALQSTYHVCQQCLWGVLWGWREEGWLYISHNIVLTISALHIGNIFLYFYIYIYGQQS